MSATRRPSREIDRLPKTVRDTLGQLLREGCSAAEARERLDPALPRPDAADIDAWRAGGYPRWLEDTARLEHLQALREAALEVVAGGGGALYEGSLELAAACMFELLKNFDPRAVREQIEEDPAQFARILGIMARLSDGGLKYEKYRAQVAERKTRLGRMLREAGDKGLTPERRAEIERELGLL